MTPEQHNLFGPATTKPKAKQVAKAAPTPSASPLRPSKLSPADQLKRAKNLASWHADRSRMRIGDIRMSEIFCKTCGEERVEELVAIAAQGGQHWEVQPCLECKGNR